LVVHVVRHAAEEHERDRQRDARAATLALLADLPRLGARTALVVPTEGPLRTRVHRGAAVEGEGVRRRYRDGGLLDRWLRPRGRAVGHGRVERVRGALVGGQQAAVDAVRVPVRGGDVAGRPDARFGRDLLVGLLAAG